MSQNQFDNNDNLSPEPILSNPPVLNTSSREMISNISVQSRAGKRVQTAKQGHRRLLSLDNNTRMINAQINQTGDDTVNHVHQILNIESVERITSVINKPSTT